MCSVNPPCVISLLFFWDKIESCHVLGLWLHMCPYSVTAPWPDPGDTSKIKAEITDPCIMWILSYPSIWGTLWIWKRYLICTCLPQTYYLTHFEINSFNLFSISTWKKKICQWSLLDFHCILFKNKQVILSNLREGTFPVTHNEIFIPINSL